MDSTFSSKNVFLAYIFDFTKFYEDSLPSVLDSQTSSYGILTGLFNELGVLSDSSSNMGRYDALQAFKCFVHPFLSL